MIKKALNITESLFMSVPQIRAMLEEQQWPDFYAHLQDIHHALKRGPNPDFYEPLIRAMQMGFHSRAERVISAILDAHRVDYRFITGRIRRFHALEAGKTIPQDIIKTWGRVYSATLTVFPT